jgi:hypothetical protein
MQYKGQWVKILDSLTFQKINNRADSMYQIVNGGET